MSRVNMSRVNSILNPVSAVPLNKDVSSYLIFTPQRVYRSALNAEHQCASDRLQSVRSLTARATWLATPPELKSLTPGTKKMRDGGGKARAEEEEEDKCQGDVLSLEEWRKERRGGEMDAPTLTTSVSEVSLSLQSQGPHGSRLEGFIETPYTSPFRLIHLAYLVALGGDFEGAKPT
ncbi:hypothetical protein EYF80_010278 [Liparis tanakae]|uniref:Uncharacterized protein n=1 Tax=Liparis tanakae TaxID=230148 RepID=A0A4Z2IPR1_9TELE|nr:hypothetical protein EYF80_010278 [Liparis tanakae]